MKPATRDDENLTEENIIKTTLSFLKAYYRKQQRSGETLVSSDMRGLGGIIADGYLTFPRQDGTWFVATFEATSSRKRKEVRYRTDRRILIWDGIALAALATAAWMIYTYLANIYTIRQIGESGVIFCLSVVFILSFFIHHLVCLLFEPRRYRYIYAIEQFKRYHADEQWIAIADNVFHEKDSRHFQELRHRCIYNGFGLIIVSSLGEQLRPVLSITPSRQELFGQRRRIVRFLSQSELTNRFQRSRSAQWWRRLWRTQRQPSFGIDQQHLNRFQRRFYKQIAIAVFSLLVVGALYLRERKDTEIYEPDEDKILAELRQRKENPTVESPVYKLDTPYFYPPPFDRTVVPYLPVRSAEEEPVVLSRDEKTSSSAESQAKIIVGPAGEDYLFYDCARFYNLEDTKYIILEGIYDEVEIAFLRVGQINETGIAASVLWLGCFMEWENRYAVYLDLLYNDSEEARIDARSYEKMLAPEATEGWLEVRSLSPLK